MKKITVLLLVLLIAAVASAAVKKNGLTLMNPIMFPSLIL